MGVEAAVSNDTFISERKSQEMRQIILASLLSLIVATGYVVEHFAPAKTPFGTVACPLKKAALQNASPPAFEPAGTYPKDWSDQVLAVIKILQMVSS